jgi:hypothetical protein
LLVTLFLIVGQVMRRFWLERDVTRLLFVVLKQVQDDESWGGLFSACGFSSL